MRLLIAAGFHARGRSSVFLVPSVAAAATIALYAVHVMLQPDGHPDENLVSDPQRAFTAGLLILALIFVGALRITRPFTSFFTSLALVICLVAVAGAVELSSVPLYWLAILTFAIRVNGIRLLGILFFSCGIEVAVASVIGDSRGDRTLFEVIFNAVVTYAVFALIGRVIAHGRDREQCSQRELIRANAEHAGELARSLDRERHEMARELHDVAAFYLTGMLVQARAAESTLSADPQKSREFLVEAIKQGQRSMESLRQMVGFLRYAHDDTCAPQPGIADIADLVEIARPVFGVVNFTMNSFDKAFDRISADSQLCCYRIVQESLSNAIKHAPGGLLSIQLCLDIDSISIIVENSVDETKPVTQGFGIPGMLERVSILNGNLTVESSEERWRVLAWLPSARQS